MQPRRDEGAERRPAGCQPISHVLARLMSRKGYARIHGAAELDDCWSNVCGDLASKCRCGRIRRGTLEIVVENSVVLQELVFRKPELIARLRQQLPQHGIQDLRLRLGAVR